MDRPWDYNEGYEVGAPPPGGRKGGTDDVRVIPITTLPHSRIVGSGGTGGGNDIASSKYASFVLGGGSAASAPSPLAREAGGCVRSLLLSFAAGLGWHLSHALAGYLQSLSAGAADDDSGRSSRGKDGEEDDTSEEESSRRRVATALAERLRGKIYAAWRDALIRLRRGASDAYAIAGAGGIDWPLVLVFGAAVLWRGRGSGRQVGPSGGGGSAMIYPLVAAAWLLTSSRGRGGGDGGDISGRSGGGKRGKSVDDLEDELTLREEDDGAVCTPTCSSSFSGGERSIRGGLARDVSRPAPSPSQATTAAAAGAAERRSRSESVTSQATQTTIGEDSASSVGGGEKKGGAPQQRYFEMLVHNVSHTDLVLSLGCRGLQLPPEGTDLPYALCRPRFSAFDLFTRRILDAVKLHRREVDEGEGDNGDEDREVIISFPRYERSSDINARYELVTPRSGRRDLLPVGFDLDCLCGGGGTVAATSSMTTADEIYGKGEAKAKGEGGWSRGHRPCRVSPSELPSLRMRGRDVPRLGGLYDRAMQGHWEAAATGSSGAAAASSATTPRRRSTVEDLALHSSSCLDASGSSRQATNVAATKEKDSGAAVDAVDDDDLRLNAVFFPLLSTLMRRWHETISDKYSFPVAPLSQQAPTQQQRKVKKVVVLVTGVGTPRNWTHTIAGNSTESCAELMEAFINALYPDVTVVRIHSKTNIFRYDENISFAKRELSPCVDAYRDAHARGEPYPDEISGGGSWVAPAVAGRPPLAGAGTAIANADTPSNLQRNPFNPDWKQTFSVTLSFADGSPARTHAIQTSLRPYRPAYFHFWQLKTFWHDTKMCDDDVEVHSFEDMETVPAMEVEKTSPEVRMVVAEMRKFRAHFMDTVRGGAGGGSGRRSNDIREFWLRKTRKPVLAVLLVNDPERGLVLYRGTNMEVSMPTGSLCAERNVIGTALASDPALKREDLLMVAVLAVPLPPSDEGGGRRRASSLPLLPPPVQDLNVCAVVSSPHSGSALGAGHAFPSEILKDVGRKLSEQQHQQQPQPPPRVQVRAKGGMTRTLSAGSFASLIEEVSAEGDTDIGEGPSSMADSWVVEGAPPPPPPAEGELNEPPMLPREIGTDASTVLVPPLPFEAQNVPAGLSSSPAAVASPPGTPVRKVRLYRSSFRPTFGGTGRKKKRTVVVHSAQDINPLKPCGACNEWLKKIAESNPYFKVVTFTDADCNGVYVTPCQD